MKRLLVIRTALILQAISLFAVGCRANRVTNPATTQVPYMEENTLPTPAEHLDEINKNMSSDDPDVRLISVQALDEFGDEAIKAVSALRKTLFDPSFEIRRISAIQLG